MFKPKADNFFEFDFQDNPLEDNLLSGSLTQGILSPDDFAEIDQCFPSANNPSQTNVVSPPVPAQVQNHNAAPSPTPVSEGVSIWELITKDQYAQNVQIAHLLKSKNPEICQQLNQKQWGETPLQYAVSHGRMDIFGDLMLAGADFFIRDVNGHLPVYRPNRDKNFALWLWDNRSCINDPDRIIIGIADILVHALIDDLQQHHKDLLSVLELWETKEKKSLSAFLNRNLAGKTYMLLHILANEKQEYIELTKFVLDRFHPATARLQYVLKEYIMMMSKNNHSESLQYLIVCQGGAFQPFLPSSPGGMTAPPARTVPPMTTSSQAIVPAQSSLEKCGQLVGEYNRFAQLYEKTNDAYADFEQGVDVHLKKIVELNAQLVYHLETVQKLRADSSLCLEQLLSHKRQTNVISKEIASLPPEVRARVSLTPQATGVPLMYMKASPNNNITGSKRPLENDPNDEAGPSHRGNGPR